jgi:hypothetical protein
MDRCSYTQTFALSPVVVKDFCESLTDAPMNDRDML